MNLLDENYPDDQLRLLRQWHIPFRQIGADVGHYGLKDADIVPLLHRLHKATFSTQDADFCEWRLCHGSYCLVWLDVRADDAAYFTRRFLRHSRFSAQAKRMGIVARVHRDGIQFWNQVRRASQPVGWEESR